MRKLLFVREVIVLVLLSCCTFLYGAEKATIQNSTNPDIQSIVLKKDNLIIKSKGKVYTFKLSELLKYKKTVPQNLDEAFKYNGKWYFSKTRPSSRHRLQYVKGNKYRIFKDYELFLLVSYKEKQYFRDTNKNVYKPYWEMKNDSCSQFIPAKEYIEYLGSKIKLLKETIKNLETKISKNEYTVKADREKYINFLKQNNYETVKTDKNGNVFTTKNSNKYDKKIKKELNRYERNIKKQEKTLRNLIKSLNNLPSRLQSLQALKLKLENLYKLYAINTQ